jgi:hypothetical protein
MFDKVVFQTESQTMNPSIEATATRPIPGLCGDCLHARRIESDRGSVFLLCELSFVDDRFQKYPRLPVLSCRGYEQNPPKSNL